MSKPKRVRVPGLPEPCFLLCEDGTNPIYICGEYAPYRVYEYSRFLRRPLRHLGVYGDHFWEEVQFRREMLIMSFLRKVTPDARREMLSVPYPDSVFAESYPALYEYMTVTSHEGMPRIPASLTVFLGQGQLRGVLNDRDQGLALWACSETLLGLLEEVDALLQSPSPPWRVNAQDEPQRPRKKKA